MAQGIWTPGGGFDRQPQGPVGVDWSNPLSSGLAWIGTPLSGGTTQTGTVGRSNATQGLAWDFTNVSTSRINTGYIPPTTGPVTMLVLVDHRSTAVNQQYFNIGDRCSIASTSGGYQFYTFNGSTWQPVSAISAVSDGPTCVVGRHTGSNNSIHLRVLSGQNSGYATQASAAASSRSHASWQLTVGGDTENPSRGSNCAIFLAAFWNRALSDAEIASISANPWQLLCDTSDALIFDMGAGGGAGSHTLTGANSTQSNTGTTAAIAQAHALAGANGVQANTAGTGSIGSDITLAGAAGSSANTGSVGAIGQVHVLVGAASAQANGASTGTVTQVHALAGANATQVNTGSTAALGETVITLAGSAGSSANTGSVGAITQAHVLVGAASVQDNVAAASAIVQAHVLAGANAVQSNLGSVGAITAFDFSNAASPYVAFVPYTNHIAFVPAVSNTALRGL